MLGNSKQIAELQEKVSSLEASLATATGDVTKLQADLAKANADLQAAIAKGASLEADLKKALADVEAANARAAAAEASITTQVNARLASAGVDPIQRDPKASEGNDGKKGPDASLPPRQRAAAAMGEWNVFGKK